VTTTEDTTDRPADLLEGAAATRSRWHPLVVLPELAWMLALIFGYSLARLFVVDAATGYRNAAHLWTVERWLHLPSEAAFQGWALQDPTLIRLANEYYASAHFPITAAFLFWVYVWRHDAWRWVRNAMTVFTAASLLIEALLPMAPPRLVHGFGLVDTGVAMGQSVYPASPHNGLANQFAAMPSVHVGWALLVATCVIAIVRSRWRWLTLLHPLVTILVVTVTANHYWSDGIVAALLLGGTFLLPLVHRRLPSRRAAVLAEPVPVSG
jgi:PAP2 superfamily